MNTAERKWGMTMARYVNLDDSEVVYCGSDGDYEKYNIPYDMPFADVVPVVRCNECKHYGDDHFCCYQWCTTPEEFCSRGEKRR